MHEAAAVPATKEKLTQSASILAAGKEAEKAKALLPGRVDIFNFVSCVGPDSNANISGHPDAECPLYSLSWPVARLDFPA